MADTPQWLTTIPEDIRGDASLQTIPDVPTLAKTYVNAQRLIGTKRLEEPQATWKPEQWDSFYNTLGRPESPDKYTMPKVELPEGVKIDDKRLGAARTAMHKAGLTDKQATEVLNYYFGDVKSSYEEVQASNKTALAESEASLKKEWGDKYQPNVDIAKAVITNFGDDELRKYLDESGHGNDPQLVKFLSKIGQKMLEDTAAGKGTTELNVGSAAKAKSEIDVLKTDKDFQAALMIKSHVGHAAAVQRWEMLHRMAAA